MHRLISFLLFVFFSDHSHRQHSSKIIMNITKYVNSPLAALFLATSASLVVAACESSSSRECRWVSNEPRFPPPGRNLAIVGNCPPDDVLALQRALLEGVEYDRLRVPPYYSVVDRHDQADAVIEMSCSGDLPSFKFIDTASNQVLAVGEDYNPWCPGGCESILGRHRFLAKIMPSRERVCD